MSFDILIHGLEDHEKYPNGGTKEQRTVAFEEDAKKNEPARTFTFDTKKLLER